MLEAIYKKDGVFKYPEVFQCENGPKCKSDIKKLLEKQKIDIRRTITNSKHTHTAFVKAFEKQLLKQLFKPMEAQDLQYPEKVLIIWIKRPNRIAKKMKNTKLLMIVIKPKNATTLGIFKLDKSGNCPEENVLPEDGLCVYMQ